MKKKKKTNTIKIKLNELRRLFSKSELRAFIRINNNNCFVIPLYAFVRRETDLEIYQSL